MKKDILGHVACPICPHPDAEVKSDKNGKPFIFCPDCATQVFTRRDNQAAFLLKKMRPVTVTVTVPEQKPAQPVPEPTKPAVRPAATAKPVPKPNPPQKPAPPADPAPSAPKKTAGWFSPLLAQGGN